MVAEQINRAKMSDRETLLQRPYNRDNREPKDVLVITYNPALNRKVHTIIHENFNILQCDDEHKQVFANKPIVAFRRAKNLKDILVRARIPTLHEKQDLGCRGCQGRRDCNVCELIEESTTFSNKDKSKTYDIRKGPLHCNSRGVVYLLQCKTCDMQYVGICSTKFCERINNYKSQHRCFISRQQQGTLVQGRPVPQAKLHAHFQQADHNGLNDCSFKVIDAADTEKHLRQKESFWQETLKVFSPNGLNEREVPIY